MVGNRLNRLAEWLETWCTTKGAYNGFVIHRFSKKRMFRIHDTAWSQAAIIRGYANLYEHERLPVWQKRMQLAADLQLARLDRVTGKYKYAGHEDDRFCSLVHCALANCALLRAMSFVNDLRKRDYLNAVQCNVETYCERLWVEAEGAYRFSEIDYWSPDEDRFVINFNMIAAENLILLWEQTRNPKYKERACRLGEWLLAKTNLTRMYYEEFLNDKITVEQDSASEWMAHGGMPYQFTPSQRNPDNCVLIYAGLALRGICALYRVTEDQRYAILLRETGSYLLAMRDFETHFFYHTTNHGKIEKRPQFIAGIGMILIGLHETRDLLKVNWTWDDTLKAIFARQYPNGSFPSFVGKNRRMKGGVERDPVWEDVAASVNWNAQLFEYLTVLKDDVVPAVERSGVQTKNKVFVYRDTKHTVTVISLLPKEFMGLYFCVKKWSFSIISFFPHDYYIANGFRKCMVKIAKKIG